MKPNLFRIYLLVVGLLTMPVTLALIFNHVSAWAAVIFLFISGGLFFYNSPKILDWIYSSPKPKKRPKVKK
jgi:hypothetical protein